MTTPEELAVIQAAMAWRDAVLAHPEALRPLHNASNALTPVLSELSRTTSLLAMSCEECNAGGHTCPGDGNRIPHGATDCGGHDIPDSQAIAEMEPALIWVERTWADVRLGDRVQMVSSDNPPAIVQMCVHLHWHVDPRSGKYNPEPLEWSGVRVALLHPADVISGPYEMDPAKPIEIEIAENEFHILNALGWENRVGVIRDDLA